MKKTSTTESEQQYLSGRRAAWLRLLGYTLEELGYPALTKKQMHAVALLQEREEALAAIRRICKNHDLGIEVSHRRNLADILEELNKQLCG